MQTAGNRSYRDAADECRRKTRRSEDPVNWLRIAEKWDALAKTLELAPSISNRTALEQDQAVQSAP